MQVAGTVLHQAYCIWVLSHLEYITLFAHPNLPAHPTDVTTGHQRLDGQEVITHVRQPAHAKGRVPVVRGTWA